MPPRTGKCTNFGLCSKADTRELITTVEGQGFRCPECSRTLSLTALPSAGSPARTLVGLFAVLVIAGGLYFAWPSISARLRGGPSTVSAASVVLRLSGSNTIGAALAPALAEGFLKHQGASDVRTIPGDKGDEVRVLGIMPGESVPRVIEIHAHGSATAFEDLHKNACDVGMASRKIKAAEVTQLTSFGDMSSPASEHVLGLDGIAVIVSKNNRIESLSKGQVAQLFTGEVTDWSQVGGAKGPVTIYARDDKSGTYDTFKTLVLGTKPLVKNAHRLEDSRELSDSVARDPSAIGFIGLPYVQAAKAIAVSEGEAASLMPNRMTVATEDYPLSRRLFLYTPPSPSNDLTFKFLNFALSSEGQGIVEKTGFVGQNVEPVTRSIPPDASAHYRSLTKGAERLSLNFRFRAGKTELDNKAKDDLDRVVTFLSDQHYSGDNVLLFGFADNKGSPSINCDLSQKRAQAVRDQFILRGVHPAATTGFCSELPVASNDSDDGREKNRRVEIWVKK
jgi:phosphate transport system substrate-binding protein